jgi:hypothetical protein
MLYLHQVLAQSTATPDEADGRVYGWLPGIVTDIDTNLMQIKARIAKMDDGDSSHWLVPMGMGSVESLPEVGDPVGVVFMDGDPHSGAYFYFPQSTTKGRPTKEPIPLGLTFVGMFNFLVTQLNQLRTDFNTLADQAVKHTHAYLPGPGASVMTGPASAATPPITLGATTAAAANKGKAADGSVVSDKSTSEVVLSKRSKVR